MKFAVIHPSARVVNPADVPDLIDAEKLAGLTPGEVDHGTIRRGIGIVVGEFSLFEPSDKQHYFAIGSRLYAGPAVLYAYDYAGQTVDFYFDGRQMIGRWFDDASEVEAAIAGGVIVRPQVAIGDRVYWRWPEPRPTESINREIALAMAEAAEKHGTIVVDGDVAIGAR